MGTTAVAAEDKYKLVEDLLDTLSIDHTATITEVELLLARHAGWTRERVDATLAALGLIKSERHRQLDEIAHAAERFRVAYETGDVARAGGFPDREYDALRTALAALGLKRRC